MIKLYNTLTGKKETFKPLKKGKVGMYVCGLTVQDRPHIGHIRAAITGDIIKRYFEYSGYAVTLVTNFTDIDDKIIQKAKESGEDFRKIARTIINEYLEVSDKLNIQCADYYPEATKHIQEIQEFIAKLIEKGFAYVSGGDVYYEVSKFKSYGKLSGKILDELRVGARVEPDETKRNPVDFVLWKATKEGEPWWESPWGRGRPGWHIECSAMSMHYLGETFDIHGGGEDLIFPHHENEIAQSEGLTGKPFAKYWVHNGFLNLRGEKMSKSIGNVIFVRDILKIYNPDTVRLYMLSTHYRNPIDYYEERLKEQEGGYERLKQVLFLLSQIEGDEIEVDSKIIELFREAMDDDFNTPKALSVIYSYSRTVFEIFENEPDSQRLLSARKTLSEMLGVLGLFVSEEKEHVSQDDKLIDLLLAVRSELREKKEFGISDKIRDNLRKLKIEIEDTDKASRWKRM
ncbi:MAG: cysteine--tRNA ligase [Candidatus Cloacimonadota bacterium]|nr:MAG: cysteine--tRNA ligase [Candidatus Cloacimonadota bacterium]